MRATITSCGSGKRSPGPGGLILLVVVWLAVGAGPAAALVAKGEIEGGGLNVQVSYASRPNSSQWAVELRDGSGQVWPGMLLGPQGQIWARLPGLPGRPGPGLVARHTQSGQQAIVTGGRKVRPPDASGDDWWLLGSNARGWVEAAPAPYVPSLGQRLWVYTYLPRKGSLGRNSHPAQIVGDGLNLGSASSRDLGLVTTIEGDQAVGLLSGPASVATLARAQEALSASGEPRPSDAKPAVTGPTDPAAPAGASPITPAAAVSTAVPAAQATVTTTTLPPPPKFNPTKENNAMPDLLKYFLGLLVVPFAAWLMGLMVFRATWGHMSPNKGVATGMTVFWVLVAMAEYAIWVGAREPGEALVQLTFSVGLPSLLSTTVIVSNLLRRLRD